MMKKSNSMIIQGIADSLYWTSCDIRVHLSKRFYDPDPTASAKRIFYQHELDQPQGRAAVLIYINLRKGTLATIESDVVQSKTEPDFWERFRKVLRFELQSTQYERAIFNAVRGLALALGPLFPPVH